MKLVKVILLWTMFSLCFLVTWTMLSMFTTTEKGFNNIFFPLVAPTSVIYSLAAEGETNRQHLKKRY